MYIIVAGGGEVGYYLARILLKDGHEILVIESDAKKCDLISEDMGDVVVRGDSCEARTLEEVGAGRADMLIAVTGDDDDNLVTCQVAKHKFSVPQTIARIKNPRRKELFEKLGIDLTVSSTELILAHIEQELPSHPLVPLLKMKRGNLEVVEVKVAPDSKMVGKKLGDFKMLPNSMVFLVVGNEKGPQIPTMDTVLEPEDEIIAVTESGSEEKLRNILSGL
ncbi:MAG: TrkA family potassium uptake protein [Dehalococcoidia bacterium]